MSFDDKNCSKSVCEACGKEFSCGAESGKCWCFEVTLTENSLEKIRQDYEKCLCHECLSAFNEKQNFSE